MVSVGAGGVVGVNRKLEGVISRKKKNKLKKRRRSGPC